MPKRKTPHTEALEALAERRKDISEGASGRTLREVLTEQDSLHNPDDSSDFDPDAKDSDSVPEPVHQFKPPPEGEEPDSRIEPDPEPIQKEADPKMDDRRNTSAPYQKNGDWFVSLTIDGESTEVPLSQLRASAQKDAASTKRFQAAAQKERETQERERRLQLREQELAARLLSQPQSTASPLSDEDVEKLYGEVVYAEEDQGKALLKQAFSARPVRTPEHQESVGRGNGTSTLVDVDEAVRRQLELERQRQWEAEVVAAREEFRVDYADVYDDENLRSVANARTVRIMELDRDAGLSRPPSEILKLAGDFARQWAKIESGGGETNAGMAPRVERKRQLQPPVSGSGHRASAQPVEEKPPTRSEVVEQIRKSRGQGLV